MAIVLTDSQSKPCAAVVAGGGCIGLSERCEDVFDLFFRHADAGIGHSDIDPLGSFFVELSHQYGDLAILGEFTRIAEQIEKCLSYLGRVVENLIVYSSAGTKLVVILLQQGLNGETHLFD